MMELELALDWRSAHAGHHDRHFFAGVELEISDLPVALKQGAAAADLDVAGRPARLEILPAAVPPAPTLAPKPCATPLATLTRGLDQLDAVVPSSEPYARAHEDDAAFYAKPRLVDHLDADARERWKRFHGQFLRDGMQVLDLMASHDSHLPAEPADITVAGLGMNQEELAANPRLVERSVHDLNRDTTLPYGDDRFDLVLCALSIEYLARPVEALRDVRRVMKGGGRLVVSFSERWFPPKVISPWPKLAPFQRVAWVLRHARGAGFVELETWSQRGYPRPPDDKYALVTPWSDPLYAVSGSKP